MENPKGTKRRVVHRTVRCRRCRACCSDYICSPCHVCFCSPCGCDCSGPCLPIVIIAALVSAGLMLSAWCVLFISEISKTLPNPDAHWWMLPFVNIFCALLPGIPLFCCGGATEIDRLVTGSDGARLGEFDPERDSDSWYSLGWFVTGMTLTAAFAGPILTAQITEPLMSPTFMWISGAGAWCFTAAIILGLAFSIRLTSNGAGGGDDDN